VDALVELLEQQLVAGAAGLGNVAGMNQRIRVGLGEYVVTAMAIDATRGDQETGA
jgi:hypothetical protein